MLQLGSLVTPSPREFTVKGRGGEKRPLDLPLWKSWSFGSCMVEDLGWAQAPPIISGAPIIFVWEDISCITRALIIIDT